MRNFAGLQGDHVVSLGSSQIGVPSICPSVNCANSIAMSLNRIDELHVHPILVCSDMLSLLISRFSSFDSKWSLLCSAQAAILPQRPHNTFANRTNKTFILPSRGRWWCWKATFNASCNNIQEKGEVIAFDFMQPILCNIISSSVCISRLQTLLKARKLQTSPGSRSPSALCPIHLTLRAVQDTLVFRYRRKCIFDKRLLRINDGRPRWHFDHTKTNTLSTPKWS